MVSGRRIHCLHITIHVFYGEQLGGQPRGEFVDVSCPSSSILTYAAQAAEGSKGSIRLDRAQKHNGDRCEESS